MAKLSDLYVLPLDDWIEVLVKDWLVPNLRPAFRATQWPVDQVLNGIEMVLVAIPLILLVALAGLIAWWSRAGAWPAVSTIRARHQPPIRTRVLLAKTGRSYIDRVCGADILRRNLA
jgi:ABC-type proline/glycine betaine transport system permease subunit